jgi:hypothetical protein
MHFSPGDLARLQEEHSKIKERYYELLSQYARLQLNNQDAYEYVRHGFLRRIKTLQRCIENIYTICPPERADIPSQDELDDIIINLQSFVFNIFGCIDNLAWIWVKEKQLKNKKGELLSGGYVGLMSEGKNQIVRESFSQDFQDCLCCAKAWYKNLEDFRHALGHRIPLYAYGSPIFKAVQKKQCTALYRALKKSPKSPEFAVGEGSERSHVDRSVVPPE